MPPQPPHTQYVPLRQGNVSFNHHVDQHGMPEAGSALRNQHLDEQLALQMQQDQLYSNRQDQRVAVLEATVKNLTTTLAQEQCKKRAQFRGDEDVHPLMASPPSDNGQTHYSKTEAVNALNLELPRPQADQSPFRRNQRAYASMPQRRSPMPLPRAASPTRHSPRQVSMELRELAPVPEEQLLVPRAVAMHIPNTATYSKQNDQ
jgi:hypothetical protein